MDAERALSPSHDVTVKLLGLLGRLAGQRETLIAMGEGATVLDLLAALGRRYGPEFTAALFRAPGEVRTHLRVFLDDDEAEPTDPVVRDGHAPTAALLVLPIFEGGSR